MAEILDTGYISLRTLIVKEWNRLILLDDKGKEVYSTTLDADNWIHEKEKEEVLVGYDQFGAPVFGNDPFESNQTLEYEITITGEDVSSLPATVNKSLIQEKYSISKREKDEKYRDCIVEEFDSFTFENVEDSLTIKHTIRVPKLSEWYDY